MNSIEAILDWIVRYAATGMLVVMILVALIDPSPRRHDLRKRK